MYKFLRRKLGIDKLESESQNLLAIIKVIARETGQPIEVHRGYVYFVDKIKKNKINAEPINVGSDE